MMKKSLLKKLAIFAVICTVTGSFVGCGNKENEKKTFTIAYAPNESTEQSMDARKGLAEELGKDINMEVKEIQASDYNAIVEALRTGKADMAYMGPLAVALANERAGAEPIVMKAEDGDKAKGTYKSLLITSSKNSDINSIKDIKGKTIAFVDPDSTSGNLVPCAEIMKAFPDEKLTSDILHSNKKFFEASSFSGKHQAGLQAVVRGDIDVVPISDQILESEIKNGNVKQEDIKIINTSAPIPAEAMVVNKKMTDEVKNKVKDFLIAYNNESYFDKVIKKKNARFVSSNIEDYQDTINLNKVLNESK